MSTARLEIVVGSGGVMTADKALKQLTATAKETEKQQRHMAAVIVEVAAAEERAAAKAIAATEKKAAADEKAVARAIAAADKQVAVAARAAQREAEAWNDAKQKALARYEKQAEAAEKAAARQVAATAKAVTRENELWNNAIQRAKAGLDGVLPVRPSLQRIEAQLERKQDVATGAKEGALNSVGLGVLAGGAAGIAAAAVQTLAGSLSNLKNYVVENLVADDNLIARLGGVTDSAEQANETFADLEKQTFGKLPSTVDEVANAFIQLGNNGLQNGQVALKAYSNVAAQTGVSLGTVTNAVQMATMGNYRSLREFGIKVKEEGSNLQVTFRGQTETIGNNAVAIESYMQSLGNVQFAGAVERQMDTVGGSIKKQHDAWEKLINVIGDSSLGSVIASSVGSSVSVIDTMAAAIESLFGKVDKGLQELERKRARMQALAKTAFPTQDTPTDEREDILAAKYFEARDQANREKGGKYEQSYRDYAQRLKDQVIAEHEAALQETKDRETVAAAIAKQTEAETLLKDMYDNSFTAGDKALKKYNMQLAKIDELASTPGFSIDVDAAKDQAYQNYAREGSARVLKKDYLPKIATGEQTGAAAYSAMVRKQEYEQFLAAKEALTNKETAERESYMKRREDLAKYLGPETAELLARNEELWGKHLDDVAAKSAQKQLELQRKLANIGIGPQSQMQQVSTKTAGSYYELGNALEENLSGKNGEKLKTAAEETYKEKSIAIERERAREIAAIQLELVGQSVQNAEAMFGGLTNALKNSQGEQSAAYRTMFAVQKGFGIAAAEVAMFQSMAEASKQPFPASIPLYIKAAAQGAQLIAQISSLSYSGAYDSGGDVPARSRGLAGERGVEVVGPAGVLGREQTAALLGGGGRNIRIVNAYDGGEAVRGFLGSTRGEQVFINFVKRNGSLIRSVAGV